MAKKLKETYIHTDIHSYRQTDRLPLVVLSAAVAAKNPTFSSMLRAAGLGSAIFSANDNRRWVFGSFRILYRIDTMNAHCYCYYPMAILHPPPHSFLHNIYPCLCMKNCNLYLVAGKFLQMQANPRKKTDISRQFPELIFQPCPQSMVLLY